MLFQEEMQKYKGVTTEFNSMLKRKNLLEAKIFKRRYEKISKHLNGMPAMEKTLNPFYKLHTPSVFNESTDNTSYKIPQNKELFDFVIKEAFSDMLISIDEIRSAEKDTADQIFAKIR